MKQHITKKQWDELSEMEQYKFFNVDSLPRFVDMTEGTFTPNIGQMIEFLGDGWYIACEPISMSFDLQIPSNENLCDALWEAVKYKLKDPQKLFGMDVEIDETLPSDVAYLKPNKESKTPEKFTQEDN